MADHPTAPSNRVMFATTWGVILTTSGAAIGLGNIWRFPYMMGQYGGSAFLIVYLLLVIAFGIPGLMVECALGRATRRGPAGAFHRAKMPGAAAWSIVLLVTILMAGSYYVVVLGDVLMQSLAHARIVPGGTTVEWGFGPRFALVAFTIAIGCVAVAIGLRRGIELTSRICLPVFFVLFGAIIVYVLRLDGALDGLRRFLVPRVDDLSPQTTLAALGQAFFSLGLGGTLMVIFGSYLRDEDSIPRIAFCTAAADVGAAMLAGVIIVPAVFAFGLDLEGGPGLMFTVLPTLFDKMPAGGVVGAAFFGAVFLVGLLSIIAAYEVLVGAAADVLGWSRAFAAAVVCVVQLTLCVPAIMSNNYIGLSDLIWGSTMMPVGSVLAVVALTWCVGRAKALEQIGRNSSMPVPPFLYYWIKYVLPIGIVTMLIYGWVDWLAEG